MNWLWELQMVQQPMEMVAIPESIFEEHHYFASVYETS